MLCDIKEQGVVEDHESPPLFEYDLTSKLMLESHLHCEVLREHKINLALFFG